MLVESEPDGFGGPVTRRESRRKTAGSGGWLVSNVHCEKVVVCLPIERAARDYPKMQILSVPEISEGKRFETPTPMGQTQSAQKLPEI